MAYIRGKYVLIVIVAFLIVSGFLLCFNYRKETKEGFYGLKSKFNKAVSKVKTVGSEAKKVIEDPKKAAKKVIIKTLEKVYEKVIPGIESHVANSSQVKKALYNMAKEAVIVGYNSYKSGTSYNQVILASLDACLKASKPFVDAIITTQNEKERAMINNAVSNLPGFTKELSDNAKLSTAMEQAGFKTTAPAILAKLNNMDRKQQAEFLYSKTGNAQVYNTIGA